MRRTNFVGLRLIAASLVLVGHVVMTGPHPWDGRVANFGLLMLFSISGYLVSGSWRSDPNLGRFLLRRFLRIWPAYAAMIVICAAIAWPSRPDEAALFLRSLWYEYHPVGINGSIWMMPIEVSLYLLLALAGGRWLSLIAMAAFAGWMTANFGVSWADFGMFFVAGVLLQAYPSLHRWAPAVALAACGAYLVGLEDLGNILLIPFGIVWIGTRSWPVLRSVDRFGDLSLGTFLWHGPVLHFIVVPLHLGMATLATVALTLPLALLSWHAIESGALRLKPTGRGRSPAGLRSRPPSETPRHP